MKKKNYQYVTATNLFCQGKDSVSLFKSTFLLPANCLPVLKNYKRLTVEGSWMALIPGVNGIGNSLGLLLLSFCRYLVIFTRRKACCLPDFLLEGKLGTLGHFLPSPLSSTSDANVKDTPVSLLSTTTNLDTFSSQVHFLGAVCWPFLP